MKYFAFILFLLGMQFVLLAQTKDTVRNQLKEIVLHANKRLLVNSKGHKVLNVTDSILLNNIESFTSLLRFNAPIYFRENGPGGTSSASFRGTSASNTAVVWNGININSVNNGQTGFNSLTVGLFDEINVRSGGGSIEFGSGAIGGTIHLNDMLKLSEIKATQHQIFAQYGSFHTLNSLYKLKYSSKKYALNFGVSYNRSDNDFPFRNSEFRNFNGDYENFTLQFSNTYQLSKIVTVNFYTTYYFGDRLFSGELPNPTSANDKYQDINQRNLLEFQYHQKKLRITTRFAYLFDEYRFFDDKERKDYSFGLSRRYFANSIVDYHFDNSVSLTFSSIAERIQGKTNQIASKYRTELSQSIIFNHKVNSNFSYDVKLRKDYNSDFSVPFIYATGLRFKPIQHFFLRANFSRNYRVPTFNDLFWPGLGNQNLIPETSTQAEVGFGYQSKKIELDFAYYFIDAKDRIVWIPNGDPNRPGVWTPINISKTRNQGIEASLQLKETFFNDYYASLTLNYTYVNAKDRTTNNALPFIPNHLFNCNITLQKSKFTLWYQQLINDDTYTTQTRSEDFKVNGFLVSNLGIQYQLLQKEEQKLSFGIRVNNLLNADYQIVQNRPMPGINYNLNINYKF